MDADAVRTGHVRTKPDISSAHSSREDKRPLGRDRDYTGGKTSRDLVYDSNLTVGHRCSQRRRLCPAVLEIQVTRPPCSRAERTFLLREEIGGGCVSRASGRPSRRSLSTFRRPNCSIRSSTVHHFPSSEFLSLRNYNYQLRKRGTRHDRYFRG